MISWLESTSGAQSQSWTSSASASNATSADAAGVGRTASNSWTYFANFSRTSTSVVELATFDQATNSITVFEAFSQSGQTVISNINSLYAQDFFNGSSRSSYVRNSSILSTRSVTTSTTQTYTESISTTQTATKSIAKWTTSLGNSASKPVFYSFSESAPNTQTVSTLATKMRDTTTTSGTEIHFGLDNTIWQCRTSDFLAEIAWTMPNVFTLTQFAVSALPSSTVTRWTECPNSSTIWASAVALSEFAYASPPVATISFPALTSAIPYTTTSQQTWQKTTQTPSVFPVQTSTLASTRQATQAATSTFSYYAAQTFTTQQYLNFYNIDEDSAFVVPTVQTTEWFNNRKTYTVGNGSITWHEFADIPSTRYRTTQQQTDAPGNQIPADYAPLLLHRTTGSYENNGTFGSNAAGITMALSAPFGPGITTGKAAPIEVSIFGRFGSALGSTVASMINLSVGKTFIHPDITAYAHRAGLQTTVFPTTCFITDTASEADWNGTLSVSGQSVSATFSPTDSNESATTTTAQFSTLYPPQIGLVSVRTNLIGGELVEGETIFAKWHNGIFSGSETTTSFTVSVVSQTDFSASSWFQPVVGVFPATESNGKTVVSFTQLRNATNYPVPTAAF